MSALVSLLLRFTDLVEAEGRVARRAVAEMAAAFAVMLIAASLAVLTIIAAGGALFFALESVLSPGAALGIVAISFALLTVIATLVAARLSAPRLLRGSRSARQ